MCPWLVLLTGILMNVMFARAVSFGNLFFLFWMEFFFCQNSVFWLVLLTGIPMNVMFARAVSFGNLIFLLWIEILFLPKLREKLDLQSRCVPDSCVLRKRLLYFFAFLTFSFGYVKIVLWKYCLLM